MRNDKHVDSPSKTKHDWGGTDYVEMSIFLKKNKKKNMEDNGLETSGGRERAINHGYLQSGFLSWERRRVPVNSPNRL